MRHKNYFFMKKKAEFDFTEEEEGILRLLLRRQGLSKSLIKKMAIEKVLESLLFFIANKEVLDDLNTKRSRNEICICNFSEMIENENLAELEHVETINQVIDNHQKVHKKTQFCLEVNCKIISEAELVSLDLENKKEVQKTKKLKGNVFCLVRVESLQK